MNWAEFFTRLGHILGLVGNDGTTTTAVTTSGNLMSSSTPLIIDTSSLSQYVTTESPHTGSSKFLSSLSTYETSLDDHSKTPTSNKPETSPNLSTGSSFPTVTGSGPTEITQSTGSRETAPPTGETTQPTGETSPHTGDTTKRTGETSPHTGDTAKPTGETSPHTGDTAKPTGETSPHTGDTSKPTGETSPHTGDTAKPTGETSPHTGETTHPTTPVSSTVAPTEKPGLSRGAVAGIVIGCLLIVAIITAAIVFVVKNRNNPEVQRLNV